MLQTAHQTLGSTHLAEDSKSMTLGGKPKGWGVCFAAARISCASSKSGRLEKKRRPSGVLSIKFKKLARLSSMTVCVPWWLIQNIIIVSGSRTSRDNSIALTADWPCSKPNRTVAHHLSTTAPSGPIRIPSLNTALERHRDRPVIKYRLLTPPRSSKALQVDCTATKPLVDCACALGGTLGS